MSTQEKNETSGDRLIKFTTAANDLIENLPNTILDITLNQLSRSRSSFSPSLNYGEIHASESTMDFILNRFVSKKLKKIISGLKIIKKGQVIPSEKKKHWNY